MSNYKTKEIIKTGFENCKSLSVLIGAVVLLSSCTGVNLRSWPIPMSPNTHPIESYSEGGVLLKGGVFYHFGSSVSYSGQAKLEKSGRACSHSFLYLVAFGSSRIYDAKVDGAINHIGMIEEEVLAILGGFYHRHCTVVVGESR
ncbi:MAG: TRL-like family protein [Leptospiraceae bacterium]|nr:TRL-like family protein [Leptospiraceae bacterium]